MDNIKISVVIPIYNGEDYIGDAIQSVLNQTYQNFEIIAVDDGSLDNSSGIVRQFLDKRLKYISLPGNQGVDIARNTGIRAAEGSVVSFLDQDDIFHPEKLMVHADYLNNHQDVDFTYNGRFEFTGEIHNVRNIFRPPNSLNLEKLLMSTHLLSPTDMVVRKHWLLRVGLWDENLPYIGGEIILLGRLFMAGCRFANVDRILNYRRYYSDREYRKLEDVCKEEIDSREVIFSDPRCPVDVLEKKGVSFSNNYLAFATIAFAQNETLLGQAFLNKARHLNPRILEGDPPILLSSLTLNPFISEKKMPESAVENILNQMPEDLEWISRYKSWAVAQRYFMQGANKIIYDSHAAENSEFAKSIKLGVLSDRSVISTLVQMIINYRLGFGAVAAEVRLDRVLRGLKKSGNKTFASILKADYELNLAFTSYEIGEYHGVFGKILLAIWNYPRHALNRGVLSILIRSFIYGFRTNISNSNV